MSSMLVSCCFSIHRSPTSRMHWSSLTSSRPFTRSEAWCLRRVIRRPKTFTWTVWIACSSCLSFHWFPHTPEWSILLPRSITANHSPILLMMLWSLLVVLPQIACYVSDRFGVHCRQQFPSTESSAVDSAGLVPFANTQDPDPCGGGWCLSHFLFSNLWWCCIVGDDGCVGSRNRRLREHCECIPHGYYYGCDGFFSVVM